MGLFDGWSDPDKKQPGGLFGDWNDGSASAKTRMDWTPWEGAVQSTFSSIPELFGVQPMEGVESWRAEHPVLDIASTLLGAMVPYGGAYAASTRIPRAARALDAGVEGTLKAFGSNAARSPVWAGALKEFYRYTPLELSRLGTGWAVDADMGDMFTDVAVSQAMTGALGGFGGFLRAGGQAAAKAARLVEGEQGLLPNFELARAMEPTSTVIGGDKQQFIYDKMQEALKYVPEKWRAPATGAEPAKTLQGRYTFDIQGLEPEGHNFLEGNLLKPNSPNIGAEKLGQQAFDVRQLHADAKAWSMSSPEMAEDFAKRAGWEDLQNLAADVAYPRRVVVQDVRSGAGQLGAWMKKSMDSGALKQVGDNAWMMQEEGGLWVGIKRVSQGTEPAAVAGSRRAPFQFGPAKVRSGDEFLIGKTAKPEKFAPEAAKISRMTEESWAKLKDPYRQLVTANPFSQEMNLYMRSVSLQDWQAVRGMNRQKGATYLASRMTEKLKAEAGLVDQATVRAFAERTYDVMSPRLLKTQKDPFYGRFYGLLEGAMRFADDSKKRIIFGSPKSSGGSLGSAVAGKNIEFLPHDGYEPVAQVLGKLSDDELQQLAVISNAQFPKKELAAMREAGSLSPRVTDAAEKLQAINTHVLNKYVIPALEEAGRAGEIRWLEGYIMPRLYKGDSFVRVVDDAGKPQFIANGLNGKEAQRMAKTVIDEAALDGKTWKAMDVESHAFRGIDEDDKLDDVYKMVHEQMGQSADAQAVVGRAMRKLLAEKSGTPGIGTPSRLRNARTGMPGAPDVTHHSLEDMVKASENHYGQLLRYSAAHTWKYRFGDQMLKWGQRGNDVMYTDLQRKATQWLGVEGQITNTLNKLLTPVLGGVLGNKAATRIANGTNSLMYAWNLGILNPTFALLNMLTPLQTVAPWISFMQNAPSIEVQRMMQVLPKFNADNRVSGSYGVLAPLKVLRQAIGLMSKPTDDLRRMFDQALSDGVLAPQLYDEFVGPQAGMVRGLQTAYAKSGWDFIKELATGMSTKSEQYSRLIAFNASYLVGKNMFGLADDALYRFTRKATETTMYGYGVMDRSRVLTGPIGSSWGLFKNWQFHFIGSMAQYAGLGAKDGVWGPMLWQGGAALALGGMGATPLVMMADGLAKWNSDSNDSFTWMRENWGEAAGDGIYFGLPALLGVSLQASSTIPGTDVTQDIEAMSNVVAWERAKQAWGAIGAAGDAWEGTGQNPLKDPNIRDKMMQAFAPRAFFRAYSAMEGDYVRSMSTGQPTVRDLPLSSRLLHAAGFNPIDIEQNYIVGENFHATRERKRDAIQDLGNAFAQAQMVKDVDSMDLILRRAMVSNVSVSSVLGSANTRYQREMFGDHLSQYGKLNDAQAKAVLGE